jgi:anti-sigma factor RsiW
VTILAGDAALPSEPQAQPPAAQAAPVPALPGSIHGVVKDKDGTVCEGAHISLTQTGSVAPLMRTAISDASGRFDFSAFPAGAFRLTISSEGFATQVISGFLHPGEIYQAPPIALLVTTAQNEVRVSASQQEIAVEQFSEEVQQRVLGAIPNFYVSYAPDAPPLTPRQKFHLAWRSSIDPITLLGTGVFAGIEQAENSYSGYGQGSEGYAKRYAANYADNFIGTMIGSAILPSLLKQDPRYFYKGTGSKRSRFLYAIEMSVVCRGDNGHWQANYSAMSAGFASAAISNLYYPAADRNGVSLTFENFGIGTAESAFQNLFQEFILRKLTPKLPGFSAPKP